MSSDESVTLWLSRLKSGRSDAAPRLWQRYVEQLVRLARRKLRGVPLRAADEEDVVLSAFEGFLRGVEDGRFPRLDDRDDLWQVLVMLTERRAIALRRREQALIRGGGQVRGESVFPQANGDGSQRAGLEQVEGREATPAFAAEMAGQLGYLLDGLNDPVQKRIAVGKLHGKTNQQLATELDISLRAVERKLAIIRDKWRGEHGDE